MMKNTKLLNPNIGYIFSIIFLIYEFYPSDEPDEIYIPLSIIILGWLFYLYSVYRILTAFYNHYSGKFQIKPLWGIVAHLIPIFNFYWLYKWPKSITDYVWRKEKYFLFDEKLVPSLLIVGVLLTRIDFAIGFAVFWTAMRIIIKRSHKFFEQTVEL